MAVAQGILSSGNISLGNFEMIMDFFANPESYEPDLTEVKAAINEKKPIEIVKRPVIKPKLTREGLINKFSLVNTPVEVKTDSIITDDLIINETEDFDFGDMDFEVESKEVKKETMEIVEDNKSISEEIKDTYGIDLDIGDLDDIDFEDEEFNEEIEDKKPFKIEKTQSNIENIVEDIDIDLDEEDEDTTDQIDIDIDIDIDDDFDDDFEEESKEVTKNNIKLDSKSLNKSVQGIEIDIDIDEDDESESIEIDIPDFDEDEDEEAEFDEDFEIDITDIKKNSSIVNKPVEEIQKANKNIETTKIKTQESNKSIENEDFDDDEFDEDFEISIDDEEEDDEIDIDIDLDEDDLDDELEDIVEDMADKNDTCNEVQKNQRVSDENIKAQLKEQLKAEIMAELINESKSNTKSIKADNTKIDNTKANKLEDNSDTEDKQLLAEIAKLKEENSKLRGGYKDNKIKRKDFIDSLDDKKLSHKATNPTVEGSKYDKYTVMNIDALYNVVMSFMIKKGVKQKPVDLNELNLEFGTENIKKLIVKQYLIKTKKGVTVGL